MPFEILDKPVKIRGGTRTEHLRRILPHRMRLMEIAKSVTQLIDEERVEFSYYRGYEVRQYAERVGFPQEKIDFFLIFNEIFLIANIGSDSLWRLS